MDDNTALLKDYIDSLTHDGKAIFGHDCRHYSPLFAEDIGRGAYASRFRGGNENKMGSYADKLHLPDGYIIVNEELLPQDMSDEDYSVIDIGHHRVAIPLRCYFKIKGMAPHEQWIFIREIKFPLPDGIKHDDSFGKALYTAFKLCKEDDFLKLFYDVKAEDYLEVNKKYAPYSIYKEVIEQKKQYCLGKIERLRKGKPKEWDAFYDRLYMIYVESDQYGTVSFDEFCTELFQYVEGALEAFWKIWDKGSVAWRISQQTRKIVSLNMKLKNARKKISILGCRNNSNNT